MHVMKQKVLHRSCSHAALTQCRVYATLASAQLQGGLPPLRPGHYYYMQEYGDNKRALPFPLVGCELLNTQTPIKHTKHDVDDPQPRPVSLDMKGSW
jgi:hypothetical protein